jgi:hypothetical protein
MRSPRGTILAELGEAKFQIADFRLQNFPVRIPRKDPVSNLQSEIDNRKSFSPFPSVTQQVIDAPPAGH